MTIQDARSLYISPRGRIVRRTYVLYFLAPVIAGFTIVYLGPNQAVFGDTPITVYNLVVAWLMFVGLAKRFNDFGAPGIRVAVGFLVGSAVGVVLFGPVIIWLVWFVIMFAVFTKSEPGANRYGPGAAEKV